LKLARVLVAHNTYRQAGGEDAVVAAEVALLRANGHEVQTLIAENHEIQTRTRRDRARAARDCVWSFASAGAMREAIDRFHPDIVHVHNTLAALSPSIYWAASARRVPIVQTLHNYRLACPQGMFLREGRICQDCAGRLPAPAVVHACYRGSRPESLAVAAMITVHRALGTWSRKIGRYLALSRSCRDLMVASGLPAPRIRIKPNFANAPLASSPPAGGPVGRFLFVGRLAPEKGTAVLAAAMREDPTLECTIVGDGPSRADFDGIASARLTGWLGREDVSAHMAAAHALVLPSIWFEPFPLVAIEALAHGLPVIASRIGSLPEIVEDGITGLLFDPGDPRDLGRKMRWVDEHPEALRRMGEAARASHERLYSAQENYRVLAAIYGELLAEEGA
jgi:glycosyltransferase involved in cell wall biosynthesis